MFRTSRSRLLLTLLAVVATVSTPVLAEGFVDPVAAEGWLDFAHMTSPHGARCIVPDHETRALLGGWTEPVMEGVPADCSATSTNPTGDYEPSGTITIPVVVHIIMNDACTAGSMTDENVQSQIDILNEDFQAIFGSNGQNGYDSMIQFELATVDPGGSPTTGITRDCNTTWFNDGGAYYNTLAWDPHNYLNIYTNNGGGALGYVPFLPADGGGAFVGSNNDRVVILHTTFGEDATFMPFHLGRTGTHELGHYFGLEHTFSGGCGTATIPGCYSSGDLICDTNSESSPYFGCGAASNTCSSPDPIDNYMDYSDDICMERFTQEQTRRMICTLRNFRPDLPLSTSIFTDGFESGDTSLWS